ncbi:hypothetical protein KD050_00340 [Psychrobacillus sp. INOP01]|uniref:hypothetical protein n=1 Tax=Psychrobacillus sp. INOP01 TaxID=2829187 RepID=UPI001BA664FD|nr:hypothetical protein [Psychrobacillus sp. INOP01]QUG41788.1 hypothetical protein KD050_00340 [Psychrobacillus sp. INOP01]
MREIQNINTSKEKRTFFQWLNFLIPYFYTAGITLILSWMIVASILIGFTTLKDNPKAFFLLTENTSTNDSSINRSETDKIVSNTQESKTAFSIIIQPFVESNFNQIIFRGLFLLFIWLLLFLTIPVAFKRLKRFKFLNLEFEVDNIEQAAIETVEISGTKARLMAYFTGDDASGRTLDFLAESTIEFKEVLEYFLAETQLGYKNHPINGVFTYKIYNGTAPEKLYDLVEESKESGESAVCNKIDEDNLWKKSYLVFYFPYNYTEYITVIESYSYSFDILDKYLFELLHKTISKNLENIEYMVALTNDEEDTNVDTFS